MSQTKPTYDVCFAPVTNVAVSVADPYHPTEAEMEAITEAARQQILRLADEKLSSENLLFVRLYQERQGTTPLSPSVTIFNALP